MMVDDVCGSGVPPSETTTVISMFNPSGRTITPSNEKASSAFNLASDSEKREPSIKLIACALIKPYFITKTPSE